jgi:hypothetical protein
VSRRLLGRPAQHMPVKTYLGVMLNIGLGYIGVLADERLYTTGILGSNTIRYTP